MCSRVTAQKVANAQPGSTSNKPIKHQSVAPHGHHNVVKPAGNHNHHVPNSSGISGSKHGSSAVVSKGHNQLGSMGHSSSSNPVNATRGSQISHGASSHVPPGGSSMSASNNHKSAYPPPHQERKGAHEIPSKPNPIESVPKVVVTDHGGDRSSLDPMSKYSTNSEAKNVNNFRYQEVPSKLKKNVNESFELYPTPMDMMKRSPGDVIRKHHDEPQKVPLDIPPPPPPLTQKPMSQLSGHPGQQPPHKDRSSMKDQRNHSYGGHNHRSWTTHPYGRPPSSTHSSSSNSHVKNPSMPPLHTPHVTNTQVPPFNPGGMNASSTLPVTSSSSQPQFIANNSKSQLHPSKLAHLNSRKSSSPPPPLPPLHPANLKKEPFSGSSSLLESKLPFPEFRGSNHSDLVNNGDSSSAQGFDAMFGKKLDVNDGMPALRELEFGSTSKRGPPLLPLHMEKFPSSGCSADKDNGLNDMVKMEFDSPMKFGAVFDFGDEGEVLPEVRKGDIKIETDSQSSSKHGKKKKEKHKHKERSKDEKKHKKEKHEKEKKHKKDKHKEKDKEKEKVMKQKIKVKEVQPPAMTSEPSEFKIKIKLGKDDKRGRSRSEIAGQKR